MYYKFLHLIVIGVLLASGCGGGGSGGNNNNGNGGNPPPGGGSTGTGRIAQLFYDFDNNGVFEGVAIISYDADGRIISDIYTYTDDGTPDTDFKTFGVSPSGFRKEDRDTSWTFEYNADGLLETWTWDIGGGEFLNTIDYSYNASMHVANTSSLIQTNGMSNTLTTIHSYTGTNLDQVQTSVDGTLMSTLDLSYDGNGLLSSDLQTIDATASQLRRDYTWRADGQIDAMETTDPDPGRDYETSDNFIYDADDRLVTHQNILNDPADNYSFHFKYDSNNLVSDTEIDMNSDGSIEAIVRAVWEDGPCESVYIWAERLTANFLADANQVYAPGTGYGVFPVCPEALPR